MKRRDWTNSSDFVTKRQYKTTEATEVHYLLNKWLTWLAWWSAEETRAPSRSSVSAFPSQTLGGSYRNWTRPCTAVIPHSSSDGLRRSPTQPTVTNRGNPCPWAGFRTSSRARWIWVFQISLFPVYLCRMVSRNIVHGLESARYKQKMSEYWTEQAKTKYKSPAEIDHHMN